MRTLGAVGLMLCLVSGGMALHAGSATNGAPSLDDRAGRGQGLGFLVPPPSTLAEFMMHDAIVLGTVIAVVREANEGPYIDNSTYPEDDEEPVDPQATPTPDPGGFDFTYYSVLVDDVLKDDGDSLHPGWALTLRISGSAERDMAFSDMMPMPRPGDRFLMALGRNPNGQSYGNGPYGFVHLDGDVPVYGDWQRTQVSFATDMSPDEFVSMIRSAE